ncbi:MAG: hypothetical protein WC523_02975 [Patescibacteria group bacterium]|jgi:3D (Asp-Asp-Asp) domain-containing protein
MKILQIINEDLVPLSKRQNIVLAIIIACVFQFVLFYAPALADEAIKQAQAQSNQINNDEIISIDSIKESTMDNQAAFMAIKEETASSSSEVLESRPTVEPKPIKVISVSTRTITAYNSEPNQTDNDPCTTANGFNVCQSESEDTIAANFLKFGTKVMIPELFGERVFVVRDRMNKRHANRVDVWMKDYDDAVHFGVKVAKVQVIE